MLLSSVHCGLESNATYTHSLACPLADVPCAAARSNAAEIAGAMHELGAMQRQAADLRKQLLANNATLQASHLLLLAICAAARGAHSSLPSALLPAAARQAMR